MPENCIKPTVLIVDDTPDNITVLHSILTDYNVKAATNGIKALDIASRFKPDIILLDVMMPNMDGYTVCKKLKLDVNTRNIPVIFITAMDEVADETLGFELGAVDYITKPVSPPIVKARVRTHLRLYDQNRALEDLVRERTEELNESRLEIIRQLGRAAEYKDNETGLHVIRISHYCRIIASVAGMSDADVDLIFNASPMHDIGKIGIPDHILCKPGSLNAEERKIIEQHPEIGARIIGNHDAPLLNSARTIALTHHEKWDGTGYPKGLKGEEIPLVGRIVAIADVFDALVSVRPYKKAWSFENAVAYIEKEAGTYFDPTLVAIFKEQLGEITALANKFADPS